jgi:hypothetical protein
MSDNPKYMKEWHRKNRARATATHAAYVAKNKDRVRSGRVSRDLRVMYGITIDDYNKIFVDQGGCCAICKRPESVTDYRTGNIKRLSVDHDHETGIVRGLLCHACNVCLGFVEESTDIIDRVRLYLMKHKKLGY